MTPSKTGPGNSRAARLGALRVCIDAYSGHYRNLRDAPDVRRYLEAASGRADEEILTEPLLASIVETVLGFPKDAYFAQYGKGGQKPDFTPMDLIAHPFVLDAKASGLDLAPYEPQIRRYMSQRHLDYGVLFNLREVRVYAAGAPGHDASRSFAVLPLWEAARGEALPASEAERFDAFCDLFSYREMGVAEKTVHVRRQDPWNVRLAGGEPVEVDVEYLVEQLRILSRTLADDAAAQADALEEYLRFRPARRPKVVEELELIALDIAPGTNLEDLPETLAGWRTGAGLAGRAWRQYLLRVAYLALTRILLYRAWEDVDFAESYLYDGGFDREYERLAGNVRRVLGEAFLHGGERYPWLYGRENSYDWYRPREAALVEVLYGSRRSPWGSSTPTSSGASTSRTWRRSTATGSDSSSPRARSYGSCSTVRASAGPRGSSGSRETSAGRGRCSTSRPGRAGSSSMRPGA